MVDIADIAQAAALIGDPARANMLCALKDDGALSATELAHVAGVAPNTASGHLAKLAEAGLVAVHRTGRWRYYRLAHDGIADVVESLEALAGQIAPAKRASTRAGPAIREARLCYDHLAGRLGVGLTEAMVGLGYLERTRVGLSLKDEGMAALENLGVTLDKSAATRRPMVRQCPDWSEGRSHLGGKLAAALLQFFTEQGWLRKRHRSRILELTPEGRQAFRMHFGMDADAV